MQVAYPGLSTLPLNAVSNKSLDTIQPRQSVGCLRGLGRRGLSEVVT